jgi:peptidoglycan/LPS O-acetylase OafA/YrhL
LGYRPALDGVRGLAILLVMGAHFGLGLPQGGRIGVTIFFALSGYLITALLLAEHTKTGRIDLKAFWIRRGRRLLPALFILVAAFLAYHLFRGGIRQAIPAALITVFYLANYAANFHVNLGLLAHTWSLAVEEQFYLWWPLALIVLLAWWPKAISRLVVVAAIGIALIKIWSFTTHTSFFFPISRGDALLGGAALAVLGISRVRWAFPIGLIGALAISFVPGDPPWIYVVAAALGVLIVAGAEGSFLAWSPLVFIGTISYSLYLWHQPAERILKAIFPTYPLPVMIVIDTVVSLGLALGSYYIIEARFRKRRTGAPVVAGTGDPPVGPSESASPPVAEMSPPTSTAPAGAMAPAVAMAPAKAAAALPRPPSTVARKVELRDAGTETPSSGA